MRFFHQTSPSNAARAAVAMTFAALLAAALTAPLSASAASAVTSGTALAAPETSVPVSPEATGTLGGVTLGMLSLPTTTSPEASAPVEAPARAPRSVRQIVVATAHAAGLDTAEVSALLWICYHESRFHPTSVSRSGCHGLFQLSSGMAHGRPWKDPVWNTKRAIRYMKGRYGGILQAKAFWQRHHWY